MNYIRIWREVTLRLDNKRYRDIVNIVVLILVIYSFIELHLRSTSHLVQCIHSFVFVYFSHIFYFEFWARSCVFERPRLRWPRRYWLTAPCITDAAPPDSKSTRNRISYNQKQYLGRKKAKKNGKNPRLRVFYSVTWMSVPLCFVETPYVPSPGRT